MKHGNCPDIRIQMTRLEHYAKESGIVHPPKPTPDGYLRQLHLLPSVDSLSIPPRRSHASVMVPDHGTLTSCQSLAALLRHIINACRIISHLGRTSLFPPSLLLLLSVSLSTHLQNFMQHSQSSSHSQPPQYPSNRPTPPPQPP